MKHFERIGHLIELLKTSDFDSHESLLKALKQRRVPSSQASLSRDLTRLGVHKIHGVYQLPGQQVGVQIQAAGTHLLVLKTSPGQASARAAEIDRLNLDGIIGTVAGDDTIFIATRDQKSQNRIHQTLLNAYDSGNATKAPK